MEKITDSSKLKRINTILTDIYSRDTKEEFLNDLEKINTRYAYATTLSKIAPYEKKFGKDIFEMTIEELEETLQSAITASSETSADAQISTLKTYLEWSLANNHTAEPMLTSMLVSHLSVIDRNEYIANTSLANKYITKRDLFTIADKYLVNKMDAMILICFWNCINGYENSEIRNLKYSNCNFNDNSIKVVGYRDVKTDEVDEYGNNIVVREEYERIVYLTAEEMEYFEGAKKSQTQVYIRQNGNFKGEKGYKELAESDYLFQSVGYGDNDPNKAVEYQTVQNRLRDIKRWFQKAEAESKDKEYNVSAIAFTAKDIESSRVMYELSKLKKPFEKLTEDDFRSILREFRLPENRWQARKSEYKRLLDNNMEVVVNNE